MAANELERDAGEMLVVGFDGAAETPPEPIAEALRAGRIGGVILFSRNVESLDQVVALNRRIHELTADRDVPPFVAVDQEGGSVMRIRDGVTPIPPMREVGDRADPKYVADVSEVIASELRTLGFNLNFAPVLDVDTNPDNPVIGDRAFDSEAEAVARAGGAFLHGHAAAGVVSCGKHFPGHGDTERDSHLELPVLSHDPDRLRAVEFLPFRRTIGAGVPMIMTAHILLPGLDAVHPATFSDAILGKFLRDKLDFEGVVVTDDLEMNAVADRYEIEEMIDLGLDTSVDIFLICHSEQKWQSAFEHLVELGSSEREIRDRIAESAERIRKLKRDFFDHQTHPWRPEEDWKKRLATPEHRRMVQPDGDFEA